MTPETATADLEYRGQVMRRDWLNAVQEHIRFADGKYKPRESSGGYPTAGSSSGSGSGSGSSSSSGAGKGARADERIGAGDVTLFEEATRKKKSSEKSGSPSRKG